MSKYISTILLLLSLLAFPFKAAAFSNPWVDGYTDPQTEAVLLGYYTADEATEALTAKSFKSTLNNYAKTAIAMQGIMLQKYMENKHGLRDVGILGNAEENYYYRRIFRLVSKGIVPETYRCAYLLAKKPQGVLYWAPFMLRICNETMDLCGQFETVVTNGKLGFEDIAFPTLNKNLLQFADLKEIGRRYGADLKGMMSGLGDFNIKSTSDSVVHFGLKNIKEIGASLAVVGAEELSSRAFGKDVDFSSLIGDEGIAGAFHLKTEQVRKAYDVVHDVLDNKLYDPAVLKDYVTNLIYTGGKIAVDKILSSAIYNAESYLSDYLHALDGQYYRQKVTVYIRNSGSEVMCDYNPKMGSTCPFDGMTRYDKEHGVGPNNDEIGLRYINSWSDDWTLFIEPEGGEHVRKRVPVGTIGGSTRKYHPSHTDPTSSDLQAIRTNSENHAGWSQSKVKELNARNDGNYYSYEEQLHHGELFFDCKPGKNWYHQIRCYYAYSIKVVKSWNKDQIYWEKDFDSQNSNADIFEEQVKQAQRGAELEIQRRGLQNATVVVERGDRRYYQVPSNANIKGATMASFILNCNDHNDLGHGTLSWKENAHINNKADAKDLVGYAERTNIQSDGEDPVAECQALINSLQSEISSLDIQIANKEKRGESTTQLEKTRREKQDSLYKAQDALEEAREDAADDGDLHRLPWLLNEAASRYHLTWKGDGQWDGTTYTRKAGISGLNGTVTFSADFSVFRREKYFCGIRVHRAIFQLDWKIYGDQSSSTVVETMALDTTKTEEENKQAVSDKQQQIMDMYPDCSVEVSYGKSDAVDTINDTKSFHLLWVSDRLALAREIHSRLTIIYSDLILLHKFLYETESLKDFLKTEIYLQASAALRDTIASDCFNQWIGNSRKVSGGLFIGGTLDGRTDGGHKKMMYNEDGTTPWDD